MRMRGVNDARGFMLRPRNNNQLQHTRVHHYSQNKSPLVRHAEKSNNEAVEFVKAPRAMRYTIYLVYFATILNVRGLGRRVLFSVWDYQER